MTIYHQHALNPDIKSMVEHPSSLMLVEHTGVEKLEKTIDRLMVAGMNLYDHNRGAYSIEDPDTDAVMPYMTKWTDEKDVNLRMREIQRRLRNKVRAQQEAEEKELEIKEEEVSPSTAMTPAPQEDE